jgi:hypothetical protein
LVELVETKQNIKKKSSHILRCKWASQDNTSVFMGCYRVPLSNHNIFETTVQEFHECMITSTEKKPTHKQT